MTVKTYPWDPSAYLDSEEMILEYINATLEEGDAATFALALGHIARARGMTEIAKEAGVSRESLYKSLRAEGNPEFATILKVLKALQLNLTVKTPVDKGSDNFQAA
jgi:probable addiction module antidote protein